MAGSSEPVGLSPSERVFLRALQSQGVPFMIVGIAAARLQGAPVVTEDIDLWFAEGSERGIAAAATEAGVVYVPGGIAMNPPYIRRARRTTGSSPVDVRARILRRRARQHDRPGGERHLSTHPQFGPHHRQ